MLQVGVVVVGSGSANESLKARTMEVLSSRGVVQVCVGSVFSPLQLPFAVKKMLAKGGFTAVIVVAAFTEEVRIPFRQKAAKRGTNGVRMIRMKLIRGAMCVYIRREQVFAAKEIAGAVMNGIVQVNIRGHTISLTIPLQYTKTHSVASPPTMPCLA